MKKLSALIKGPDATRRGKRPVFPNAVLVLDLDSTLIYSSADMDRYFELGVDNSIDLRRRTFRMRLEDVDMEDEHWWCVKRPGLAEFLQNAREKFGKVGIWTAAERKYAEAIVAAVSADMGWPDFIWHRAMCERDKDGYLYKPLRKLARHLKVPAENMVIVDDTRFTFHDNEDRAIWIPKWQPKLTLEGIQSEDTALDEITSAWEGCARKTKAVAMMCLPKVNFSTAPLDADTEASFNEPLE